MRGYCRGPNPANPACSLLFALTTLVSGYTLQYHKFHGNLPGYDSRKLRAGGNDDSIDPDKAAFSMAPHDDEAYERVQNDDNDTYLTTTDNSYGSGNPYSADDYDATSRFGGSSTAPPGRNNGLFDADTEYGGGGGSSVAPAPTASNLSYGSRYDDPAQFPAANYDRIDR